MLKRIFINCIKKFFLLFHIKISKVSLSERTLTKFNAKHQNIQFLQIGANDGISFDCLYEFATQNQWKGVVVEPLDDFYRKLCMNYEFYENITPVKVALHPTNQEFKLYRVNPRYYQELPDWTQGIASFSYDHLLNHLVQPHQIVENISPSVHLMQLIDDYNLYNIDYLQIDTEGFDAEVIKMIDFSKIYPKLIKFEHINLNADQLKEVTLLLRKYNYKLIHDHQDYFAYRNSL